jgi:hypothetical protein
MLMRKAPIRRDPEVLQQKHDAAVEIRRHSRLFKEIAAIQHELERRGETKGI